MEGIVGPSHYEGRWQPPQVLVAIEDHPSGDGPQRRRQGAGAMYGEAAYRHLHLVGDLPAPLPGFERGDAVHHVLRSEELGHLLEEDGIGIGTVREGGTGEEEARDPVRMVEGEAECHRRSHRCPTDIHLVPAQGIEDGHGVLHVAGKPVVIDVGGPGEGAVTSLPGNGQRPSRWGLASSHERGGGQPVEVEQPGTVADQLHDGGTGGDLDDSSREMCDHVLSYITAHTAIPPAVEALLPNQVPVPSEVDGLIARSRSLGSEPWITNYGGGNTSAKAEIEDPVTGERRRLLYVKGSGGDLGSLTLDGLAVLDLERVLALRSRYRGEPHEDELVGMLAYCRFGPPGPAPSLDTAFHAFLPAAHVDHTHATAVIALATSARGEELTRECFGERVGWLEWRRPGFTLAFELLALVEAHPDLEGVVLGGHGLVSWGETAEHCEAVTRGIITRAAEFVAARTSVLPAPAGDASTAARAARLTPRLRGLCSTDGRVVAEFRDDPDVLAFLASPRARELAEAGTSCPDHFLRTRARPLFVSPAAGVEELAEAAAVAHAAYREAYRAYYGAYAEAGSPPLRGADPRIVLVPGMGMWAFGPNAREAAITADYYRQAMAIMLAADQLGGYRPLPDRERFRIEYWDLEAAKLTRRPPAPPLEGSVALVAGAASGIGRAIAGTLARSGVAVVVADLDGEGADRVVEEITEAGGAAVSVPLDVTDTGSVAAAIEAAVRAYGGLDVLVNSAGVARAGELLATTTDDWDAVSAVFGRGTFLLSREAARVMVDQGTGGDIVHVVSKNAVVAGPDNVAYGAAKAAQLHEVRLLAAELGRYGIRVNAVNPDGVVRDSGLFRGEWAEARADAHGVDVEDLPTFYASRTLLGEEVLPDHVAAAVLALVDGTLPRTTGAYLPVDGGLPAAFPR